MKQTKMQEGDKASSLRYDGPGGGRCETNTTPA